MSHHEPLLQLNYIQQCLSQNKRPIGFFLSAGCPFSIITSESGVEAPLIPDIAGLTKTIKKNLFFSPMKNNFAIILSYFSNSGNPDPNIEEILTHIRSLRQVAGNESIRGIKSEDLENLEIYICNAIVNAVKKDLPESNTSYHKLSKWINAVKRDFPVEIFTTNYDLLIEQALEFYRVPYFDGFIGSNSSFFDSYSIEGNILPPSWARLWKLHGSINWFENPNKSITRRSVQPNESNLCCVIHPSHLKYDESRKMPYLAMIDRLKSFIKQPHSVLITCGYSFHDEHINTILDEGLHSNSTGIIFALLHSELEKYPSSVKIAKNNPNFNLLGKDGAIIGTKQRVWAEKTESDFEIAEIVKKAEETTLIDPSFSQVIFNLGNFNQFGSLLEDIMGSQKGMEHDEHIE